MSQYSNGKSSLGGSDVAQQSDVSRSRKFLVGLDVQSSNNDALVQAFDYATLFPGSRVEITWAVPLSFFPEQPLAEVELPAPQTLLRERVSKVISAFGRQRLIDAQAEVMIRVVLGPAAQELEQQAYFDDTDLIIIAASDQPRNRLEEFFTGSVTSELVKSAPCPLLVMRPKLADAVPQIEPAPGPGHAKRSAAMAHRYTGATRNQTAHENMPLLFPM